jgi:hypothetical protein
MKQFLLTIIYCLLILTTTAQPTSRHNQIKDRLSVYPAQKHKKSIDKHLKYNFNQLSFKDANNPKSPQVLMQKMDSLIFEESYDGQTESIEKDEFTYNNVGLITSYFIYIWDYNENKWIEDYQSAFTYNTAWNIFEVLSYTWDLNNNQWIADYKDEYAYTENNQLTTITSYYWEQSTNSWVPDYKEEYAYATNLQAINSYIWDIQSAEWVIGYKIEFQYDAVEKLILETSFDWEPVASVWENSDKLEFFYSADSKLESLILSFWYSDSWELTEKEQFSYNAEGDLFLHTVFEPGITPDNWIQEYKEENEFNNQFSYNELLIPEIFNNNALYFNHMLTQLSGYEFYEGIWEYLGVINFYYSEIDIAGIQDKQPVQSVVFPNPASDQLRFSWNENTPSFNLEIYNAAGMLVLSQLVVNKASVSISQLPEGLYLYKLSDNYSLKYMDKFIKQ